MRLSLGAGWERGGPNFSSLGYANPRQGGQATPRSFPIVQCIDILLRTEVRQVFRARMVSSDNPSKEHKGTYRILSVVPSPGLGSSF